MSDETEDSASPAMRMLISAFAGDQRPATLEEMAREYARMLSIADVMVNLLEVAGNEGLAKIAAIEQFRTKFNKVADGIAEDSKALMAKKREDDNG